MLSLLPFAALRVPPDGIARAGSNVIVSCLTPPTAVSPTIPETLPSALAYRPTLSRPGPAIAGRQRSLGTEYKRHLRRRLCGCHRRVAENHDSGRRKPVAGGPLQRPRIGSADKRRECSHLGADRSR